MSTTIGIREFKNRATQIVRLVRERKTEVIVTVDGAPAAVVRPFTPDDTVHARTARLAEALRHADALAKKVSAKWRSDVTAAQAVHAQRR